MLSKLTEHLTTGAALDTDQVRCAVEALVEEQGEAVPKAEFLTALARKGESVEEIAAFAGALRGLSVSVPVDPGLRAEGILDVCGTGGDKLNTFNISTTVAIVAAAAGVVVAKHGNRAITSQSGSSDVLEALGIRVDLGPDEAAQWLRERRFAFLFAPRYHPAFKHIAPARKLCAERGQRTIFNFLGPLLNPARPSAQLMGVSAPGLCEPLARVLQSLGLRRGMVVSGTVPGVGGPLNLDECSTLGLTTIAEFHQEHGFATSTLSPENFPIHPATLADLAGGDRETNARWVRAVISGQERGPKRDAVLLNAGAALFVAGRTRSMTEGWDLAGAVIDDGRAQAKLEELAQS